MGRSLAANAFTFLIVVMLGLAALAAWGQKQFRDPGPLSDDAVFEVTRGSNLTKVADALVSQGIIANGSIFRIGARYTKRENGLKFGEYAIPARASMDDILEILTSGKSIQYFVTIPEGMFNTEIIAKIQSNADLTGEILNIPSEGMMAPDTYSFLRGDTRQSVVDRMIKAQEKILDDAWNTRNPDVPLENKAQLLVLASIVESEAGGAGEWATVASVFYNRLSKGIRLQADATLRYGLTGGKERIRRGLRQSELAKDTPYNTYVIPGLTPTPISNPGREAILATASPEQTDYLYFVANGEGGHAFANTLQEHNRNVARWREIERSRQNN